MNRYVLVYVLIAVCIAWPLNVGMLFSDLQSIGGPEFRREQFREQLGVSLAAGTFFAVVWPIGVPLAWCVTGFAEHGIWRTK